MKLPSAHYRTLCEGIAATPSMTGAMLPWWRNYSPAVWLEALILQESGARPSAVRYEPHQDVEGRADAKTDGDTPGIDDGTHEDDKSYGLVQVMGYNLRKICGVPYGVPMDFSFAFDPLFALASGVWILRNELVATAGDMDRALARYNGGPTGDRIEGGRMRRQAYVEGVAMFSARVLLDRGGHQA